eukprot:gnl/MRDRNA2_/MRDRNA2_75967_c0_seq1.p1 gnl/MRDRNA2_/MRDRNA2_75967_c0~~gnl/MRDRNA2_/MRDRNA2_75967_c0_seq1.p1  ORF type:complete len:457 (-),score=103.55 gnl/MRDRNA2_/MRDRNA2_75967_c0_seq1:200-1570(-)
MFSIIFASALCVHAKEMVATSNIDAQDKFIDHTTNRLVARAFKEVPLHKYLDNAAMGKPAMHSLPAQGFSTRAVPGGFKNALAQQWPRILPSASLPLQHLRTSATKKAEAPQGTPVVKPLPIRKRPRRNRRSLVQLEMFAETVLTPANFIMPVFVHDGTEDIPISSMPGISRLGVDTGLLREVGEARELGVKSVVIFPKTPDDLKTPIAEEAFNPNGLAQRAIRNVKEKYPDVIVYTDIALDPYNSLGHDGIVRSDGVILNDETIHQLCKQAVSQAEAGADYVSPSDMMDGRIGAIRDALDAAGFTDVGIMAYSAKYNSAFYGPFREALDSNPRFDNKEWVVPKDKATYQQNAANYREALLEARLDEEEGADILMVKPAMPYLDIIKGLHEQSDLPIAAYHVSGEYAMLKAAAQNGWLNERAAALEALLSIRRAGATVILTYYAKQAAKWLLEKDA